MRTPLPPWASGPLELLVHAELHLRAGDDFDRRLALVSFDNALEVAIATYLTLNPIQRRGRSYPKVEVEKWMRDFHTKLDFIGEEVASRGIPWEVDRAHIVWAHDHRNEQYHGGHKGTPERQVLNVARKSALWVFGLLFDVADPEAVVEREILSRMPASPPAPERRFDLAIDAAYPPTQIGEQTYYVSELLFAVDPAAYRDLGGRCSGKLEASASDSEGKA